MVIAADAVTGAPVIWSARPIVYALQSLEVNPVPVVCVKLLNAKYVKPLFAVAGGLLFQGAAMGALPTLRAATDPDVEGGQYYGPDGLGEQRGHPKLVSSSAQSHDEDLQHRLWTVSEELTGVTYPV